jgi:hypothetical protein
MLNMEINKTLSQFTMVKDRVARIKIINPQDSGVSNKELTNAPGIINPRNSIVGQAIRYLDSPNIPPELVTAIDIYKDFFFLVAGSFELEQAQTPGREVVAYKAIAALLERASTMLKGKIRRYGKMIRIRGRMYLSHVMNWYTEERFISYEVDGEEVTEAINGQEMIIPAKLNVISGSTMPVSRVQEREEAAALYDKGAIDQEELLKKMDWPEWRRVVGRMKMGPIGEFIEKLRMLGFPPMTLQYLGEIAELEMKEFERTLEKGELPTLQDLMAPTDEDAEEAGSTPEDVMAELEALKIEKEVDKVAAEIKLIEEKANSEKINQTVALAGIGFDKQKLAMERATVISDIKKTEADKDLVEQTDPNAFGGDNGDGKKGDNGDGKKKDAVAKAVRKPTKTANKRAQGSYDERGMRSNNKQS